ncbi:MAG TPA: filamentous hemagglutinin N-terminal domain-containing protein, partial [Alphaproteobacteria bacterium]|nr:filamentous hemagglutinin N-terminal domain-containing protein [Alphaproteobacteria bacterium]
MKPLNWPDFSHLRRALLATSCLAAVGAAMPVPLAAAPSGLSVGSGQVTVSNPNAQTTLIQQGTNKAILNWNSFSVGSAETVTFQQPNASSVALNRVTGSQASSIFGHLTANGQVFLLNPNGILFGRNSVVNVAGLVATTSGIKDSDFLAGNYNFGIASPNPNAGVVNQGTIQAADGGYAVLSGAYVQNDGLIQARLGKVVLAGTTTFAVDFAGDNLLSFAVTGPVTQVPVDADGNPVTSLVSNTGSIVASGGQVTLTARAAKGILDNVINTSGMIEATTATMVNGTIVLDAGDGGVTVGGGLSATGLNPGETGGTINVLGGAITIASGATINASGDSGGGSVFIGGNFHGAGPLPNAWTTNVQQGAVILADAVTYGNGGNVAVWADGYTAFNGAISAQGGALGGNGGFVETSGHQGLSVQTGSVNTLAPNGQAGTWLLDPMNITVVSSGGTASLTQVSSYLNDAGLSDTINASLINAAASNVTLQATNDITFNTGVSITTAGIGITAQAGNNINVNLLLDTNGGNIKLSANDNFGGSATGSGSITIAAAGTNIETIGTSGGSITLTTNGGTGSINTGSAPIQTTNGAVSISAGSGGLTLGNGSGTITTTGSAGTVSLTSAGSISLNSGAGILTTGAGVTVSANDSSAGTPTGSGSITLTDIGISTTGKAGTTVSMTNGSNTLSIPNLTGIAFSTGQTISGPGIPSGTT